MPSPFPGMDPYLEGSLWMSFHTQLAVEIARQLAPLLRPKYLALTAERFVLEAPDAVGITAVGMYPDVAVARLPSDAAVEATALAPAPLRLATVMATAVPHVTVEIRDVAGRQLVTAIEVLSPTNKRGEGRVEYLAKRQRLLASTAHLLEIDLLRAGQRVPMLQALPEAPYFVLLSRAEARPWEEVWPIALDEPLPTVPVPLLAGDADVPLALQRAFTAVYDAIGYDLALDYSAPPEVPVPDRVAAWLAQVLAASRG
jgi:hypothetical protein